VSRVRSVSMGCVVAALAACGGSGSAPAGPSPGDNPNQMVISSAGVLTPKEITISAGSRVLFINNHSKPHYMASDPHPEHTDCQEMDPIGILAPGARRETSNFVTPRTCGIHDHEDFANPSLQGRIIIR